MKKAFICSRYSGDVEKNAEKALELCRLAIDNGRAPFAPHLIYPQFLDDASDMDRSIGIDCGKSWLESADEVWICIDDGISSGMREEIKVAQENRRPIILVDNLEPLGLKE